MTIRLIALITLSLIFGNAFELHAQQTPYRPVVGQPHPNFTLPKIEDRKPLTLSDYRGKKILLLHFASW